MAKICQNCGKKIGFLNALLFEGNLCTKECRMAYKAKVSQAESEREGNFSRIENEIVATKSITEQQVEVLKEYDKDLLIELYFRIYDQFVANKELEEREIETLGKIQEAFGLTNEDVEYDERIDPHTYKHILEKEESLSIEFEISIDNISEFNSYYFSHSPSQRTTRWLQHLVFPSILFLCLLILSDILKLHVRGFEWSLLGLLAFTTFWIVYLDPRYGRRQLKNRLKRMYNEGRKKGYMGKHRLSLTPDGIADSTDSGESKDYWKAVEKIIATDKYVFIYTSALSAHIIPKRAFSDELKYREFVEVAKLYHGRNVVQ